MTDLERRYIAGQGWRTVPVSEGGGGSLPDWWTLDNTPDQERVTFNGGVQSLAPAGYGGKIVDFGDEEGNTEFVFDKDGLQFWLEAAKVLDIDHVGAVTISPSDPDATALDIVGPADLNSFLLRVRDDGTERLSVTESVTLQGWSQFLADSSVAMVVDTGSAFTVEANGGGDVSLRVTDGGTVTIPDAMSVQRQPAITSGVVQIGQYDGDFAGSVALKVTGYSGGENILGVVEGVGFADVLTIGPTGAVTISPTGSQSLLVKNDNGDTLLQMGSGTGATQFNLVSDFGDTFKIATIDSNITIFHVQSDGDTQADQKIGFFAANPVTQPTGVAVDVAGIHAALVTLGLIAA